MDLPVDAQPAPSNTPVTPTKAEAGTSPVRSATLSPPKRSTETSPAQLSPTYQSPMRHHHRNASAHRTVKETLDARSEYTNRAEDGHSEHRINQYLIRDEIGRGSFGAVHLAVDQYGQEYAVKEFSKARLRKRAQSNILRRPRAVQIGKKSLPTDHGFDSPLHRSSASDLEDEEAKTNPLFLIKEEIAIMKKLNHPNLVSLIEVLDDPEEDSLYMVLEMCKKGVVMKVGLSERADPYNPESCRCWFRDLILGIEYLHAQGVVHRDIKPDNLLITSDDVLKVVDFGVSEMFEKESKMMTAKSAGSPAFLAPELCVTKHGDISGKAADIWSMGISLYCLRFGKLPFEQSGVLELYEAIKNDEVVYECEDDPQFVDLMKGLLEKDPKKRINMEQIRDHPWVTKEGTDPLLPKEENTAELVELPTELEVNHAITIKVRNLLVMMRAVKKFKSLLESKRSTSSASHHTPLSSPLSSITPKTTSEPRNEDINGKSAEALYKGGITQNGGTSISGAPNSTSLQKSSISSGAAFPTTNENHHQGQAHDPLAVEPMYLGVGVGSNSHISSPADDIVAESPMAAGFNIYDKAYDDEVERIRLSQGHDTTIYLTRRVSTHPKYEADENMINAPTESEVEGKPHSGWKTLLDQAKAKSNEISKKEEVAAEVPKSEGASKDEKVTSATAGSLEKSPEKGSERTTEKGSEKSAERGSEKSAERTSRFFTGLGALKQDLKERRGSLFNLKGRGKGDRDKDKGKE